MANTFKFGNKNWATKEGSVLAYNDENNNFKPLPFDFTRSSTATRVNKDGLIEVVGIDEPRVDYLNNADGHLLLEPSRSNLVTQSEDLTTGWSFSSGGTGSLPVITADDAVAPDGNTTADKVVLDMNGGSGSGLNWSFIAAPYTSAVATFTMTCYLKGVNGGEEIFFDFDNGNSNLITLTTEWVRYEFVKTVNYTTTRYIRIGLRGGSTTDDTASFYMWGCQLEEGSYATSYIPTSGSSVTRNAERSDATLNSSVLSNVEGTVFIDVDYTSTGDVVVLASPHDGAANKRVEIWANGSTINGFIGGSVSIAIGNTSISNGRHRIAVAYKSGDSAFYIDGNQIGVSPTAFTISALTKFSFNQYQGTLVALEDVKEARLYNTRLTNAELAALTTL